MSSILKALLILTLAAVMLYLGATHGDEITPWILSLEQAVGESFFKTWWVFVGFFILGALIALPVGALLSMGGGLVFGAFWGGLAGWLSTSIAAWLSFVAMRWWMGNNERTVSMPSKLTQLAKRLDHHSMELLMILRIVPLVPFYLINVAAALGSMPTSRYLVASFIGLAPSTFVYAMVGHSLGSWMEAKQAWDQGEILTSSLLGALAALACLAALSAWGARRLNLIKAHSKEHGQPHESGEEDGIL